MIKIAIAGILGGLLLSAAPAVAAPPVPNIEVKSSAENVHYRRYRHRHYRHRHYGYRHYRHHPRYYGYYGGYPYYGYRHRYRHYHGSVRVGPLGFYW